MPHSVSIVQYHDALMATLGRLPWAKQARAYPEEATAITTPALFFSLNGWSPADNVHGGQTGVELDCAVYVICDKAATDEVHNPEVYARALAADLTQLLHGNQFGLPACEPAAFVSASRDEFDPALDGYIVFCVSYTQTTAFGDDAFAPTGAPLQRAMLGQVPDVGPGHEADYQQIYPGRA